MALFALLAIFGRVVGVPESWKNRLVRELSLRGLEVDTRKLTIDPLGGMVARDLVVYRDGARKEERLRIGRVELNLNWLAWRGGNRSVRGRDFGVRMWLGLWAREWKRRRGGWKRRLSSVPTKYESSDCGVRCWGLI